MDAEPTPDDTADLLRGARASFQERMADAADPDAPAEDPPSEPSSGRRTRSYRGVPIADAPAGRSRGRRRMYRGVPVGDDPAPSASPERGGAAPRQSAATGGSGSIADELRELSKLRYDGIISDAEFHELKARLIRGG